MKAPLGVLILHGFTSSRATVAPIVPQVESFGLPWRLPQLRGHWTKPEDLRGVRYYDMFDDAKKALADLLTEAERAIIVGLSVGGLITLDIAENDPKGLDSIVVLAPALRFANPLSRYAHYMSSVIPYFKGNPNDAFNDRNRVQLANNYPYFPTKTFATIYSASERVEKDLPNISTPTLILASRHDKVIPAVASQIAHDRISSAYKKVIWYERSGHEMLLDCEGEQVAAQIGGFLYRRLKLVKDPKQKPELSAQPA